MVRDARIKHWQLRLTMAATSNDPWGPVGSDMAEIAQITFNK
jgi:hypothetical protein